MMIIASINRLVWIGFVGLLLGACGATRQNQPVTVAIEADVTGTYKMSGTPSGNGEDIYGSFGMIFVRKTEGETYDIAMIMNRGAPSYNSGEIRAILPLKEGRMRFTTTSESDMNCIIHFVFDENGVDVQQDMDGENSNCGFGHGVAAVGYLTKLSSAPPIIPTGPLGEG